MPLEVAVAAGVIVGMPVSFVLGTLHGWTLGRDHAERNLRCSFPIVLADEGPHRG